MATNRNFYMNIQGNLFTEKQAREFYGVRFETAILVKVVVDADKNVIGTWG